MFLDANVLFSAAYRDESGLLRLWRLRGITLLTSRYALEEAQRNLGSDAQHRRLVALAAAMEVRPWDALRAALPVEIVLPADDRPILEEAVASRATHLVTGDRKAFGTYFGRKIASVRILTPTMYLGERS